MDPETTAGPECGNQTGGWCEQISSHHHSGGQPPLVIVVSWIKFKVLTLAYKAHMVWDLSESLSPMSGTPDLLRAGSSV